MKSKMHWELCTYSPSIQDTMWNNYDIKKTEDHSVFIKTTNREVIEKRDGVQSYVLAAKLVMSAKLSVIFKPKLKNTKPWQIQIKKHLTSSPSKISHEDAMTIKSTFKGKANLLTLEAPWLKIRSLKG